MRTSPRPLIFKAETESWMPAVAARVSSVVTDAASLQIAFPRIQSKVKDLKAPVPCQ